MSKEPKQYLLKMCWLWDYSHTEVATFSVESWENISFEDILSTSRENQDAMLSKLHQLADDLTGSQLTSTPSNKLLRLYLVEKTNADEERNPLLCFSLKPICEFYSDGSPAPIPLTG